MSINEIQWESHLRNYKGDMRCPSKEEFFQYLPDHVKEKKGYKTKGPISKRLNVMSRDSTVNYLEQ